jgi:hypothetical protein
MDIVFAAGKYVSWGVLSISLTNLLVIVGMVVVFVLALVIPFPRDHGAPSAPTTPAKQPPSSQEDES